MDSPSRDDPSPQRPLLVGLHGWLLAGRLWQPLALELAPRWQFWAPDLPGFGDRPRPRGLHPSLASYGAWVAQECRRQHSGPVVLVGHSLGGTIGLHAARHLGDQLVGIVQIATGGGVYQPRPFARVRRGGCLVLRWRPRWLLQLPGSDALRSPLLAELHAARGLLACSMRRSAVSALPQIAADLTVPSLWIAGSRDSVMEPRYVRHLAGFAPRHQLSELEGAGHLPMRQMPARLAATISAWLEELPAATASAAAAAEPEP
jgi:2-succinyl-6-hydroxy-2,4-cyclohexadiene-1-carboxylate synthase